MTTKIDLSQLGLDEEKLAARVVENIAEQVMEDSEGIYEDIESNLKRQQTESIKDAVDAIGKEYVDPKLAELITGWTLQKTTEWGEAQGKAVSFTEYLVQCAHEYMSEPVDYQGKSKSENRHGSGWSKKTTRVVFLMEKHLHYHIDRAMEDALKNANAQISVSIQEAIKLSLADIQKKLKVTAKV